MLKMALWGAFIFLFAVSWATAIPSPQNLVFPEATQDADSRASRIVSGWEASEGQIPYQLSIRMVNAGGTVSSCGATLIHNEWALTAAHCTDSRRTIVIRAGAVSLRRPVAIFESIEYYNHPLYIEGWPFVQRNDIGVIKLNRFLEYSDVIQPIRLQPSAHKDKDYSGIILQASGWGLNWTRGIGVSPENLNWVYLLGESNEYCRRAFGQSSIIADSTICASAYNVSSQSTCDGDSGGPLITKEIDGKLTQIGVTSFVSGTGCHTDFPAGFIRPGHYHDWLLEVTGIDFDWDPESIEAPEEEDKEEEKEEESEEEESSESDEDESSSESDEDESSSESDSEGDEDGNSEEEDDNEDEDNEDGNGGDNGEDKEEENGEDNEEDNEGDNEEDEDNEDGNDGDNGEDKEEENGEDNEGDNEEDTEKYSKVIVVDRVDY